jgi:hypothetical protein
MGGKQATDGARINAITCQKALAVSAGTSVYALTMNFRLTFALFNDEYGGDLVELERVVGLQEQDLPDIEAEAAGAFVSVEASSTGKGAAGPGVDIVLHVLGHVNNDGASLITWGTVLWAVVHKVRSKRPGRTLAVKDPVTVGALAAASFENRQSLVGSQWLEPVCLTGGGPDIGTNGLDVWATTLVRVDGLLQIIFTSHSGLELGSVVVPTEVDPVTFRSREPREVASLFREANGLTQ